TLHDSQPKTRSRGLPAGEEWGKNAFTILQWDKASFVADRHPDERHQTARHRLRRDPHSSTFGYCFKRVAEYVCQSAQGLHAVYVRLEAGLACHCDGTPRLKSEVRVA